MEPQTSLGDVDGSGSENVLHDDDDKGPECVALSRLRSLSTQERTSLLTTIWSKLGDTMRSTPPHQTTRVQSICQIDKNVVYCKRMDPQQQCVEEINRERERDRGTREFVPRGGFNGPAVPSGKLECVDGVQALCQRVESDGKHDHTVW